MQAHPDPARDTRRRAVPESQALSEGNNGEACEIRNSRPAVSMTSPCSGWPAVAAAVRKRMAALRITTVGLLRNTGLSEATLRNIRAGTASSRPNTLVRLSKGSASRMAICRM